MNKLAQFVNLFRVKCNKCGEYWTFDYILNLLTLRLDFCAECVEKECRGLAAKMENERAARFRNDSRVHAEEFLSVVEERHPELFSA